MTLRMQHTSCPIYAHVGGGWSILNSTEKHVGLSMVYRTMYTCLFVYIRLGPPLSTSANIQEKQELIRAP